MRKIEKSKCKDCPELTYTTLCDRCHKLMCKAWRESETKRLGLPEVKK